MKIILEEFLYGRERPPSANEKNVIEAVLASKELTDLVEDLMKEQNNAREHPDDLNITNAKVYNFDASYNIWLVENEERFTDELSGLDPETVEIFKRKYIKTLLSQYKVGQMIPYFDWPGTQLYHAGASNIGTDMGSCHWVSCLC